MTPAAPAAAGAVFAPHVLVAAALIALALAVLVIAIAIPPDRKD